jgi:hypothetical protein
MNDERLKIPIIYLEKTTHEQLKEYFRVKMYK